MQVGKKLKAIVMGSRMDAPAAIARMVEKSQRTATDVSRSMGKNRNYVAVLEKQQSVPKMNTFCRLAHECGYRVLAVRDDADDCFELYSDEDSRDYVRNLLAHLPANVTAEDLIKAFGGDSASYSSDRPAKSDEPVRMVDGHGGVTVIEPPVTKDLLSQVNDLAEGGEKPLRIEPKEQGQSTEKKGDSDTKQGSNPRV